MIATTKIKMDLANPKRRITIDAMQDDRYSRNLQIHLFSGSAPFIPPQDCTVMVRYRKPDGITGIYDTLPDGTKSWTISGSMVTVALAPQVCTVSGQVALTVTLLWGGTQLSSFGIGLHVHPQPGDLGKSERYINITCFVPQPKAPKVGQYLKVAAVKNGRITALETAGLTSDGTGAGAAAPEYVITEAKRVARVAQNRQNSGTMTFLACADPHYATDHAEAARLGDSILHCGQAMALVKDRIHVDFAALFGDLVWDNGASGKSGELSLAFVNGALAAGFQGLPNFRTCGEEDWLSGSDAPLNQEQLFARTGIYNRGMAFDAANRAAGYGYQDFPEQKIRVILLNTAESADGISEAQAQWLTEALDLSTLGSGWGSLVLSHHPLDFDQNLIQVLQAAGHVLCCIHGHSHNFSSGLLPGTQIPQLAMPNAGFARSNESGEEAQTYEKVDQSPLDTAFCVVTLDRAAGKLYADHYGAGYSRVVNLDGTVVASHSITCQLANVSTSTIPAEIAHGAAFAAWLTEAEGYVMEQVTVTMGGVDITADAFDGNGVFIDAVTGDLVITASAVLSAEEKPGSGEEGGGEEGGEEPPVPAVYSVTSNLTHVVSSNSAATATEGTAYTATLSPAQGYTLDLVTVTMGGVNITASVYNSGVIAISSVNGNIAITAVGAEIIPEPVVYSVTNILSHVVTSNNAATATEGTAYTTTLSPAEGYKLDAVTVTMGGVSITATAYSDGTISIASVTGDIVITASGVEELTVDNSDPDPANYTNLVPTSTNSNGAILSGRGYLKQYKLNTSGTTESLSGAIACGYIPYDKQIIRITGFDSIDVSAEGNRICIFDSFFTLKQPMELTTLVSCGAVWENTSDRYQFVLKIDPFALTDSTLKEALLSSSYIRVGINPFTAAEDFIVTLNDIIP